MDDINAIDDRTDFPEERDGDVAREPRRDAEPRNLELLLDVEVRVSAEVGSRTLPLGEILELVPGSVLPLDKKAEEPLDLCVNGRLIARGEVVMVDDCYGLRITQIAEPRERLESLR